MGITAEQIPLTICDVVPFSLRILGYHPNLFDVLAKLSTGARHVRIEQWPEVSQTLSHKSRNFCDLGHKRSLIPRQQLLVDAHQLLLTLADDFQQESRVPSFGHSCCKPI